MKHLVQQERPFPEHLYLLKEMGRRLGWSGSIISNLFEFILSNYESMNQFRFACFEAF